MPRAPARSSRPVWPWAIAGLLLGIALTVLLHAPAHWLAAAIARISADHVQLQQTRGTLWQGSAQLQLTGGSASRDRASLPTRLHWKLKLRGHRLHLQLQTDCCTPAPLHLRAAFGWRQLRLDVADGQSHWPAALLAGLGTPWNTIRPQGRLQLATRSLALQWADGRMRFDGQVQLDAQAVSSRLSTLRPMGSYRLQLDGGNAPSLQLSTLEGALRLSGQGHWVGQRLRFTGEASAAPEREAALANLLNIIGRRTGARSIITLG